MTINPTCQYGFGIDLPTASFDEVLPRVVAALKDEGFGVLTEIDVQATLKKKLDFDFRRYLILGACNPGLAKQALTGEPEIGLLLPCNVVVQEAPEGGIRVSIADPKVMFQVVDNPALAPVAAEAEARLRRALATIE